MSQRLPRPAAGARHPLPPHPHIADGETSPPTNSTQGSHRHNRRIFRTRYLRRRRWSPYPGLRTAERAYPPGAAAERAAHRTSTTQCAQAVNTLALEMSIIPAPCFLPYPSGVTATSGATAEYRQGAAGAPQVPSTTEEFSDSSRAPLNLPHYIGRLELLIIFIKPDGADVFLWTLDW